MRTHCSRQDPASLLVGARPPASVAVDKLVEREDRQDVYHTADNESDSECVKGALPL